MKFFLSFALLLVLVLQDFPAVCRNTSEEPLRYSGSVLTGLPRIVGLNAEYLLPYLGNHLAVQASYSYVPDIIPKAKTVITYSGLGVNAYLNPTGRGLYAGIEYGLLKGHADEIDGKAVDLDVRFKWLQGKLGIKAGKRLFFRGELGYSLIFFDIDEANEFLNRSYNIEVTPTLDFLHLPNISLGLGWSF